MIAGLLDVVVRMHDPARLDELDRALFSAMLQDHRPCAITVVCQRFPDAALEALEGVLAPLRTIEPGVPVRVLNRTEPEPLDARAALLNIGLRAGTGQYAAFLDYDDVIYPEGWRLLIAELRDSGTAIAFGGILNATVSRKGLVPLTQDKRHVFRGEGLSRLLQGNFCPLHSFVLDRTRIAPADLVVDEGLAALEDYDLLLRLCARYPSSFRLKDRIVGEYLLKDDGSNTNPVARGGVAADWGAVLGEIEARKARLTLSPAVLAQLSGAEVTVADYLARPSTQGSNA